MNKERCGEIQAVGREWAPYWVRGLAAFMAGVILYKGSFSLLGVHLEFFSGIASFNMTWVLAMSVLPIGVGVIIGLIYGFGAKYLAHFPPAAVMLWDYQHVSYADMTPGSHLLPWGMWIMFVILQMEFCAAGGFIGEILIRKRRSWDSGEVHRADSEPLPGDDA